MDISSMHMQIQLDIARMHYLMTQPPTVDRQLEVTEILERAQDIFDEVCFGILERGGNLEDYDI